MKTRKTLIAAAATLVCAAGQAALAAQQMHEDQWDKVNLYANTTIAGDSVDDWGPWKEFVQPAAGEPPVAFLGSLGGDAYRPVPDVIPPDVIPPPIVVDACRAGQMCGYAVFDNSDRSISNNDEGGISHRYGFFPAVFGLSYQKTGQPTETEGEGNGSDTPIAGSWRVDSLFGETPPTHGASGDLSGTLYEEPDYKYVVMSHLTSKDGITDKAEVRGGTGDYYYYQTQDVVAGWFGRYIAGPGGSVEGGDNVKRTDGYFVAGYTTPLTDMAALQAGNVQAHYEGSSLGGGARPVPVSLNVNFGNSTWSGSWNGGRDTSVNTWTDSSGRLNLTGEVGFNVTGGKVTGSNFSATSANLSALDGTVSGNVQGSFYGAAANTAAGVAAITKTLTTPVVTPPPEAVARVAAVPVTYTNGKLTDVFVAVKTSVPVPEVKK